MTDYDIIYVKNPGKGYSRIDSDITHYDDPIDGLLVMVSLVNGGMHLLKCREKQLIRLLRQHPSAASVRER